MRHGLSIVGLGLGGLLLAVTLSLGAFALAGSSLREPINPVVLSKTSPRVGAPGSTSPTASPHKHHGAGSDSDTPTATSAPSEAPSLQIPSSSPIVTDGGSGDGGDDHGGQSGGGGHGGDD